MLTRSRFRAAWVRMSLGGSRNFQARNYIIIHPNVIEFIPDPRIRLGSPHNVVILNAAVVQQKVS